MPYAVYTDIYTQRLHSNFGPDLFCSMLVVIVIVVVVVVVVVIVVNKPISI